MAFKLNDKTLPVDVAFTHNDIQYPANWLRLSTAEEKKAIGITEVADDPVYDQRFFYNSGKDKPLADTTKTVDGKEIKTLGVKSQLKAQEKAYAANLLSKYDWYIVRKAEKDTAIPSVITTYRDAVRTACDTREKEIDACSDTAALVTLYGSTEKDGVRTPNMTVYPEDPNSPTSP